MSQKSPCVYILTNKPRGTLYTGVTADLRKRIWQHKNQLVEGFTSKYRLHTLVWFEQHGEMYSAIAREKNLKNWKRDWKISLVEKQNPNWFDLSERL